MMEIFSTDSKKDFFIYTWNIFWYFSDNKIILSFPSLGFKFPENLWSFLRRYKIYTELFWTWEISYRDGHSIRNKQRNDSAMEKMKRSLLPFCCVTELFIIFSIHLHQSRVVVTFSFIKLLLKLELSSNFIQLNRLFNKFLLLLNVFMGSCFHVKVAS